MKKYHWGLILFLILMTVMLVGGVAIFVQGVRHPQAARPWIMLLPFLG